MPRLRNLALILGTSFLMAACATTGPSATSPASSSASSLDAKGYIRQWLVLAPIGFGEKYNAEDIDKDQLPNEAKLEPKAGDKVKVASEEGEPGAYKTVQKELTWKPVVTEDFFVDFNVALGLDSSESLGGYAVAYLDAPEEMKGITFSVGTNDNGKIFLNGKSIYTHVEGRSLTEDSETIENLTLNKGINVVIFKVWNDTNNWQGCIRLLKGEVPVKNVKVRLSK